GWNSLRYVAQGFSPAIRSPEGLRHFILVYRKLVLPERQIETPGQCKLRRRRVRKNPRNAVIAQAGGPAEDEGVARVQHARFHRVAAAEAAEQKARGVAERDR